MILRYSEWEKEEQTGVATLSQKLTEYELNAVNEYRFHLIETIKPGTSAYFIDLETIGKTNMVDGASRFKDFDSFKEMKANTPIDNYKSFGEGKYGYKFDKGSAMYKMDEKYYEKGMKDKFIKKLTQKAKKEGTRFAYMPIKMTKETEFIILELNPKPVRFIIDDMVYRINMSTTVTEEDIIQTIKLLDN